MLVGCLYICHRSIDCSINVLLIASSSYVIDDESFDIYGSFYLDKPYFKGSNSTSMTAQIKVEFMHRKTTLLIGDFCSIQAFEATSEDVTCLQSGLYTFVLENVQLPVEDGESVPNWFRLGMRAYLTIDFWEKNFKSYSMGCSKVEIGTSHSSRGSFEGFMNDDIFIVAGIGLGTFLVCGMGVIYWSGRAKRAEKEELRRARLMGEVVDWGVQIE